MNESVPPALQLILQRELAAGERVVWQGRPAPSSRALTGTPSFLFGIPFLAFALFWTRTFTENASRRAADKPGGGWFGYLWGGMFVVIGATMLITPLWEWWVARRTLYAVTDRRAVLIEVLPWRRTVRSFPPEQLAARTRREDLFGRGTLVFARDVVSTGKGGRTTREVGFFGLADARHVEQLLPRVAREGEGRASFAHDA